MHGMLRLPCSLRTWWACSGALLYPYPFLSTSSKPLWAHQGFHLMTLACKCAPASLAWPLSPTRMDMAPNATECKRTETLEGTYSKNFTMLLWEFIILQKGDLLYFFEAVAWLWYADWVVDMSPKFLGTLSTPFFFPTSSPVSSKSDSSDSSFFTSGSETCTWQVAASSLTRLVCTVTGHAAGLCLVTAWMLR